MLKARITPYDIADRALFCARAVPRWALYVGLVGCCMAQCVIVKDANNSYLQINNGDTISLPNDSGSAASFQIVVSSVPVELSVTFSYFDQDNNGFVIYDSYTFDPGTYSLSYGGAGGAVTISWYDQCGYCDGQLNFTVAGTNPSNAYVDGYLTLLNDPWFMSSLLAHEDWQIDSTMYRQYATNTWPNNRNIVSMPLWGTIDGIGIGQYEGWQNGAYYWDYFSWSQNLIDSSALLWGKQNNAYNYWTQQLSAASYSPPPWTDAGQYCPLFAYPTGQGFASYADAEWMTSYHGTGYGWFISWGYASDGSGPEWIFPSTMYVDQVCQTAPL